VRTASCLTGYARPIALAGTMLKTVGVSNVDQDGAATMCARNFCFHASRQAWLLCIHRKGQSAASGIGKSWNTPLQSAHYDLNDDLNQVGMRYWLELIGLVFLRILE